MVVYFSSYFCRTDFCGWNYDRNMHIFNKSHQIPFPKAVSFTHPLTTHFHEEFTGAKDLRASV